MSTEVLKGFVAKLNTKNGTGKHGPWTLYSAAIELENGEDGPWVSLGFEKPDVLEGDYVEMETEKNGKYTNLAAGTTIRKPKNPPARAAARKSGEASSGVGLLGGTSGSVGASVTGADRQTQIVMQHSQEMAIDLAKLLFDSKALPLSGADTKAGTAKRYDEVVAVVDKLTVQLYNDVVTGRLLGVVVDAGADKVNIKADGQLPAVVAQEALRSGDPRLDE